MHWNALKYIEIHWKTLKDIEIHWKTLKDIEIHWNTLKYIEIQLKYIEMHWNALKCIEMHWNTIPTILNTNPYPQAQTETPWNSPSISSATLWNWTWGPLSPKPQTTPILYKVWPKPSPVMIVPGFKFPKSHEFTTDLAVGWSLFIWNGWGSCKWSL